MRSAILIAYSLIQMLICIHAGIAQPRDIWVHRYTEAPPGRAGYWFNDIYLTTNGNYALCGHMSFEVNSGGLWVLVTDDDGEVIINRSYHQENNDLHIQGYSIIQTDDEGFIVGGVSEVEGRGRFSLTKLSPEGDVEWWNHYGASTGSCRGVIELKAGGYVACGWDRDGNGAVLGFVIYVSSEGDLQWEMQFDETTAFNALRETENGIVLVGSDSWIQKVSFNGEEVWGRSLGGGGSLQDLNSCDDGFVICGSINIPRIDGSVNNNNRLVRINSDGDALWDSNYDFGRREFAYDITRAQDGGIFVTGQSWNQDANQTYASIMHTDSDGNLMWNRSDSLLGEIFPQDYKSSIIDADGAYVVAGSCRPSRLGTMGGLIVKIVPERSAPTIIEWSPDSLILNVLQGDSIEFWVSVVDLQSDSLQYAWSLDNEEIATDSLININFPDLGEFTVQCTVSDGNLADSILWHVDVWDLYIAASSPDTLSLFRRRGTTQTFSLDTVCAVEGDPVQYQWTLTNLDNFEREETGTEASATIEFLRSGNYQMEGLAYRGESSDNVIWTIAVRSAILDFWPRSLRLSVPPDSSGEFGVIPFNPESDSLSYRWEVDGDSVGSDSTVSLRFAWDERRIENPPHLVSAIVMDGAEGDTVRWEVTVQDPAEVGKWTSGQVDKWGMLSVSPNPFNSTTTIRYSTSGDAYPTRLTVHDLTGREVRECVSAEARAGEHSYLLNGEGLAAGIYMIKFEASGKSAIEKLVLLK